LLHSQSLQKDENISTFAKLKTQGG